MRLSHHHLLCGGWRFRKLYEAIADDEDVSYDEAVRFAARGSGAICDPTNIGIGRNPGAQQRISERAGIDIVMGAGWHREMVYPSYIAQEMRGTLADRLVSEIVHGVDGRACDPASSAGSGPSAETSRRPRNGRPGRTGLAVARSSRTPPAVVTSRSNSSTRWSRKAPRRSTS